jgi:CBS domain-containing protein
MSNSVAENIANFLKDYPPFNYLRHDELIQVATSISVVSLDKHKTLFKIDDKLHDSFHNVLDRL